VGPCFDYTPTSGLGSVVGTLALPDGNVDPTHEAATVTGDLALNQVETTVTWQDDLHEYRLTFSRIVSLELGTWDDEFAMLCVDDEDPDAETDDPACEPGSPECAQPCRRGMASLKVDLVVFCPGGQCYRAQSGTLKLDEAEFGGFSGTVDYVLMERAEERTCPAPSSGCSRGSSNGCGYNLGQGGHT
jgi:hypothetical protein